MPVTDDAGQPRHVIFLCSLTLGGNRLDLEPALSRNRGQLSPEL